MLQSMSVLTSRETVKWFTPPWLIDLVKEVQPIDLDPATEEIPQQWIQATRYYTEATNGLTRPWFGNIFLNPPFDNTKAWIEKLYVAEKYDPTISAFVLVNSNLGYKWYEDLWTRYPVFCFRDRIAFANSQGIVNPKLTSKQAQTLVYTGKNIKGFIDTFARRQKNGQPLGRMIMTHKAMNQLQEQT